MDDELMSKRFHIENKVFFFDLKENPNGEYVKITEKCGDKRSFIIVPRDGFPSFLDAVREFFDSLNETSDAPSA
jgi:hypothetical protein